MRKHIPLWVVLLLVTTVFLYGFSGSGLASLSSALPPHGGYLSRIGSCMQIFAADPAHLSKQAAAYTLFVERIGTEDHTEVMAMPRSAFHNQYAQLPILLGLAVFLTIAEVVISVRNKAATLLLSDKFTVDDTTLIG